MARWWSLAGCAAGMLAAVPAVAQQKERLQVYSTLEVDVTTPGLTVCVDRVAAGTLEALR